MCKSRDSCGNTMRMGAYALILAILASFGCCGIKANDAYDNGDVVRYAWEVEYQFWSPDCVEKVVIAINGQFPAGPIIRGRVGDTLEIQVHNHLPTESLSIHWHGIRQIGTPWADGAASITQCAINSGETFVYRFKLDKAGTYSYYGFNGLQRSAGLYGMLIVDGEKDPFEYDGEFSVLLSDWWHKSAQEQSLGLQAPLSQFRWVGEPQSLLINGRGRYDCNAVPKGVAGSGDTKACNASSPHCAAPFVMSVMRGRTYRLRIASVASISSLNFLVENHKLTVVEADGNYVEPVEVDSLDVYAGQSYSVLLSTNQSPRNYWAALNVRGRPPQTPTHRAILNYFPVHPSDQLPPTPTPKGPSWNDTSFSIAQSKLYKARQGYTQEVPRTAQKQIVLLNTQNLVDGRIKWAVNNISLELPTTPYLSAITYDLEGAYDLDPPPNTYDPNYDIMAPPKNNNATMASKIYKLPFWHTIDIVLQNANTLFPKNSEIHPWHIHGHDFWIVGYGNGKFDPDKDPKTYNLVNPPLRNTVTLFPYSWVALRFKANNVGVWLLHCNIEPHFFMGMGVVLVEGMEWTVDLPRSTMGCGLTKGLLFTSLVSQKK